MKAALTNTARLADALPTELSVVVDIAVDSSVEDSAELQSTGGAEVALIVELSCDTSGKCKPMKRNSPKLGIGFGSLNAPGVLFVI